MPSKTRNLINADIATTLAVSASQADPQQVYKLVEAISGETCGWVLLTTLKYVEADDVIERVHSSDPASHPIGGRKPLDKVTASHGSSSGDDVFLAATKADVQRDFFDYELLFELGIGSILNAPIRHAGRRLGSLNFCGADGMYGPESIETARILAGLLVPNLLIEMADTTA
ncbi:MAG: GAF domain-containing protein [Hyphomicrobiaceae bacterium]